MPHDPAKSATVRSSSLRSRMPSVFAMGIPERAPCNVMQRLIQWSHHRMLDLQQIESFRMVALTHNFTRAAAELGYSQSSVTHHVKALERELGTALLKRYRFSKTVQLTEAGRRTLDYAERLLALADEVKAAVNACVMSS
ncbi:MAG: LysR family transcriptional regulator [Limisphaerales bacterium]